MMQMLEDHLKKICFINN